MTRCDNIAAVPLLEIRNLTKVFTHVESPFGGKSRGEVRAVDDVSFDIQKGETLGLIGESGSGKTTMATALMRLTRPPGRIAGGRVMLDGRDILAMSRRELRETRLRDIALMPQGAMSSAPWPTPPNLCRALS